MRHVVLIWDLRVTFSFWRRLVTWKNIASSCSHISSTDQSYSNMLLFAWSRCKVFCLSLLLIPAQKLKLINSVGTKEDLVLNGFKVYQHQSIRKEISNPWNHCRTWPPALGWFPFFSPTEIISSVLPEYSVKLKINLSTVLLEQKSCFHFLY